MYWKESIRAKRDGLYPDFSFNFDLIEKYSKVELEPQRAMEYLRWVYSRFVREYRSNEATEALKLKLLNLIDDLELNLDSKRSRIEKSRTKPDGKEPNPTEDIPNHKRKKYLDTAQAMKFLNLSKATLWRYRKSESLSYSRPAGKVLYEENNLIEFLEKECFR
jgi:hypothetical protein